MKAIIISIVACAFTLYTNAQVIAPEEFQNALNKKDVQILDVRTADEFKNSHIKNSLQADWKQKDQFRERVQYLDKSKPVYVYCAAGVRSNAAAVWMRENGFADVKELKGGLTAWNAEQKPVESTGNIPQITMGDYKTMTTKSATVLVDFGAPWCPPCVSMQPVISELQKNLKGKFQLISLDPTVQTAIAGDLKIETLPTFLVYKNGKEIFRKQGIASYDELKTPILR